MRLLLIGAVVPHAPLLLPELQSPEVAAAASEIGATVAKLPRDLDVVVIASPHSPRPCIYGHVVGDLSGFGVENIRVEAQFERELGLALADSWEVPAIHDPIDHGALVPLRLLEMGAPVVVCGVPDVKDGRALAAAMEQVMGDGRVLFVASANTSAALSGRAPLTEIPKALGIERQVISALDGDPARLNGVLSELAAVAGSCSAGSLGAYAQLFSGTRSELLAYEHPVGVGYPVAMSRR